MATLSQLRAKGNTTSLKRGVISPQLGAKPVPKTVYKQDKGSGIDQVVKKVGDVGRQTASIAGGVIGAVGRFAVNTPRYVVDDVRKSGLAKTLTGELGRELTNINRVQESLDQRKDILTQQYRSGQMDKSNYQKLLKDLASEYSDLSNQSKNIASQADRGDVLEGAAMVAADILSAGRLKLRGGRTAIEMQVQRIPAVRELVERNFISNAKRLANESTARVVARDGAQIAAGLLIKRPILYQSNIGDAGRVIDGVLTGNYPQAVRSSLWLGSQLLRGGPLGAGLRFLGGTKGRIRDLAYGKQSFIDEISKRIGDGKPGQVARFLATTKEKAPKEYKEIERAFRIFQESNLRVTNDDVPTAVSNFLRTYTDSGIDLSTITPSKIYQDAKRWLDADDLWQGAIKSGKLRMAPEEAARYTPVRWDAMTRNAVADAVRKSSDDIQEQWEAVQTLANKSGSGFGNSSSLMNRIQAEFNLGGTKEEIAKRIQSIDAAVVTPSYLPKSLSSQLSKLGYTIAEPVGGRAVHSLELDDTRRLVSAAVNNSDEFDAAIAPSPVMQTVASAFERAGVSPTSSNQAAAQELSRAMVASLDRTTAASHFSLSAKGDMTNGGRAILSRLQQYVENKNASRFPGASFVSAGKSAVTDIRQLTTREVQEALGDTVDGRLVPLGRQEAKEVYKAILKGYSDVPLEMRGLGDRVIDTLFRVNPAQRYYSRIQSALRYTYNPFFRLQEAAETKILSHAQANNLVWNRSRADLNDAVRILDENRVFSGVLPGEAAADQVLGRITANLTRGQKRDLGGLALDIAQSRGIPLDELVKNYPDEIDDALRVIVQYPRKGILASPLARTMNLMFFPVRYNTKVSLLAANVLARQPASVQKAVLHSGFQMKEWLKSDEGIRWQSAHADAIQLFKWITPINSIESTFKLLTGPDGFGDVGLLGGLPLGFITQILDGQGVIDLNKPYVDPKTGNVFPDYIPETTKARAATALADLLNSMFTYPGRIMGLPGKEQSIRTLIKKIIETEGEDFDKRLNEENLTPVQQAWVRVLKGDTSQEAIDALYTSPAPGEFNGYTLPPLELPIRPATEPLSPLPERRRGLPKKKSRGRSSSSRTKPTASSMPPR